LFATPLKPWTAKALSRCARALRRARLRRARDRRRYLEVADDARASPEVEEALFDLFSTKETGTGLGLPIAARIVKARRALQYQTRPGHGTTFGVVLRREIKDPAKVESRPNPSH